MWGKNGINWTRHQQSNNGLPILAVLDLIPGSNNEIWVGGLAGGIARFNGTSWFPSNIAKTDLPDMQINDMILDSLGKIWIATPTAGLCIFDGTGWNCIDTASGLASNNIQDFVLQANGEIWVCYSHHKRGFSHYDGSVWTYFDSQNTPLSYDLVIDMELSPDGKIWAYGADPLGIVGGEVSVYDGTSWSVFPFNQEGGSILELNRLAVVSNSDVWLRSSQGGAYHFDGSTWTRIDDSNSLLGLNLVTDLDIDTQSNVWFSTRGAGVFRWDGSNWANFDTSNSSILANGLWSVSVLDNGEVWVGADPFNWGSGAYGAGRWDGVAWQTLSGDSLPFAESIYHVVKDNNGTYWFGSWQGMVLHRPGGVVLGDESGMLASPELSLHCFPNPFQEEVIISFVLERAATVDLSIHDNHGRLVHRWPTQKCMSGLHEEKFKLPGSPSGTYWVRLSVDGKNTSQVFQYLR